MKAYTFVNNFWMQTKRERQKWQRNFVDLLFKTFKRYTCSVLLENRFNAGKM